MKLKMSFFVLVVHLSYTQLALGSSVKVQIIKDDETVADGDATQEQKSFHKEAIAKDSGSVVDSARKTGQAVSSGDAVSDNRALQQQVNDQALNKAILDERTRQDVKSGRITPKQGKERKQVYGIASELGFMQGLMQGQAQQSGSGSSGRSRGQGGSSSAQPVDSASSAPGGSPVDFSAATSRDENVMGGLKAGSPRRPSGAAVGELVDTSLGGQGDLPNNSRSNAVQVFINGDGGRSNDSRSDLGFDENRAANDSTGTDRDSSPANGGVANTVGVGVGVAPASDTKPSAIDELETVLSAKRRVEFEKLKRANAKKNDRSPASQAGETEGTPISETAVSTNENAPGTEASTSSSTDYETGFGDILYGRSDGAKARELAASRSLIRSLVFKVDSTSKQLTGYKLGLWFVLFFFVGFSSVVFVRSRGHRKKRK
jgi:hypothetical protein